MDDCACVEASGVVCVGAGGGPIPWLWTLLDEPAAVCTEFGLPEEEPLGSFCSCDNWCRCTAWNRVARNCCRVDSTGSADPNDVFIANIMRLALGPPTGHVRGTTFRAPGYGIGGNGVGFGESKCGALDKPLWGNRCFISC